MRSALTGSNFSEAVSEAFVTFQHSVFGRYRKHVLDMTSAEGEASVPAAAGGKRTAGFGENERSLWFDMDG